MQIGDLFYYPKIYKSETWGDGATIQEDKGSSDNHLFDAIVNSKRIVQNFTASPLKSKFIRTVVELEIPFIENVGMNLLSEICYDEQEHLNVFRDFIYENILECSLASEHETFDSDMAKISLKLKNGVRGLTSDFKSLKTKTAFQTTGAIIGTLTATLVSINSEIFHAVANIVGISGGLGVSLTTIQNHILNKRLKQDSPCYFLWLLQDKVK